jgi:hypothetical protein
MHKHLLFGHWSARRDGIAREQGGREQIAESRGLDSVRAVAGECPACSGDRPRGQQGDRAHLWASRSCEPFGAPAAGSRARLARSALAIRRHSLPARHPCFCAESYGGSALPSRARVGGQAANSACVRTASISCRFDGFTSARPTTTTVGTVSFPAATDRTNALARGSFRTSTFR